MGYLSKSSRFFDSGSRKIILNLLSRRYSFERGLTVRPMLSSIGRDIDVANR